jgi:hypothetical protein
MRVVTILVRTGTCEYGDAEAEIAAVFRDRLPDVRRHTVIVDNALPPEAIESAPARVVIGGDNSAREFSAFDRGIAHLGGAIWDFDFVHLATSAFNTLYTAYVHRFGEDLLRAMRALPVCLGHLDCYNEPVDVLTYRSQHWVRTSFLFAPPAELKALGSLVSVPRPDLFFSGDPARPFREEAPISTAYRQFILDWLAGEDIGQGVRWHSGFRLSGDTLALFEKKAAAILNEHLFAIRLRALGCRLIDVSWLATVVRRRRDACIPGFADWKSQLSERAEDRLVIT